jgi:hypothetical protein
MSPTPDQPIRIRLGVVTNWLDPLSYGDFVSEGAGQNGNIRAHSAVSSSSFMIVLKRFTLWNCHSVKRCNESSFVSIGSVSQSLLSSWGSGWGVAAVHVDSAFISSRLTSLGESLGRSRSTERSSSFTASAWGASPWRSSDEEPGIDIDSVLCSPSSSSSGESGAGVGCSTTGSGPIGLRSGSRFLYCFRNDVCQFSNLTSGRNQGTFEQGKESTIRTTFFDPALPLRASDASPDE